MVERSDRTFICSVVFLDIAEYSKKPVAEQIRLKDRFNALIADAIRNVPVNERIILDTGDGAAISFLSDPEDALFVALTIRDATTHPPPGEFGPLPVRIGINLGPVRLIKDINGQPNIIGDGINVAQRVMSFSSPGQVLASRSYYEVVSSLREDYSALFRYEGSRTDKHVRAHDVYALGYPGVGFKSLREGGPGPVASPGAGALAAQRTRLLWIGVPLAVVAILAAAGLIRAHKHRTESSQPIAQPAAPIATEPSAPAAEPSPTAAAPPAPSAEPSAPMAAPATQQRSEIAPGAKEPARQRPPRPAREKKMQEPVPEQAAATASSGQVLFVVLPWGEVYADGKFQGVSPPLRAVELKPGRHVIELRNSAFAPHSEVVEVRADEKVQVRHRFQ
jgi:PEGA domain-containing protein